MAKKFKWVELRVGKYKLVPIDDPRPEVKLKNRSGTPTIKFVPSWRKYEAPLFVGTPDQQREAMEKFSAERDAEMKTNPQAARWEKSRKEWYAKQKPSWARQGRKLK